MTLNILTGMTEKQYLKEIDKILKHYDKLMKEYQNSSGMDLLLIVQEKNDRLSRLAELYHTGNNL